MKVRLPEIDCRVWKESDMKLNPPSQEVTFLNNFGCVVTHSWTRWCWGICTPQHGHGQCGRIFPQALKSRRQRAITEWQRLKAQQRPQPPIEPGADTQDRE